MDFLNTCFETTNEVRSLAYYSHLLPIVASLLLGWFAYRFAENRTKATLFFGFTFLLSLWLLGDLITWVSNNYFAVAWYWSILDYINVLFYLFILCFAFIDFTHKKRLPTWLFWLVLLSMIYPLYLTITGTAVFEFDEPNCEMYGNDTLAQYKLVIEWLSILGILLTGTLAAWRNHDNKKEMSRIALTGMATVGFLAIFSSSEYISTATDIYEITLYALFTLPIFLLIITYTIVEQGTFKLGLDNIWFVRLLFTIFVLVGVSDFILTETKTQFVTTLASTFVTFGFAIMVLRSASREALQRKEIEQLADKLQKANKRLKQLDQMKSEFVSIASHQLRSPLTAIRGYASMLMEGSYGKLPVKAMDVISKIAESSRFMTLSVEDYLNVSRIQSGNMKYEKSDFDLKKVLSSLTEELQPVALKHGLVLLFKPKIAVCTINADIGKVQQVVQNLIDNAIKYTPKGGITVTLTEDKTTREAIIEITDTGIGMSKETIHNIFEKFERAHNANEVNVTGTGLGLYLAKMMAEAMGGTVEASSEGEGKGSTFTVRFPMV